MTNFLKAGMATALAAGAVIATPISAAEGEPVAVRYNDLNLSTEAGQEQLQRRIERAAERACGLNATRSGTRIRSRAAEQCYAETIQTFEREIAAVVAREGADG